MFGKGSKISRKIELLAKLPENPQTILEYRSRQTESKNIACLSLQIKIFLFRNRFFRFFKNCLFHFDNLGKTLGIFEEMKPKNISRSWNQHKKLFRTTLNMLGKVSTFGKFVKKSTKKFSDIDLDKLNRKKNIAF